MYSFFEDHSFKSDSNESEHGIYEESDENGGEIDSDIEAALYSQIHHLENPCYEAAIEDTENSQNKHNSEDKNNDGDKSLDSTISKDKVISSSAITISDDSNAPSSNTSDVEFICEIKGKNGNEKRCETYDDKVKNHRKKWWEIFVSTTYNDDDDECIILDDNTNKRKKNSNKKKHPIGLKSTSTSFYKNKIEQSSPLVITRPSKRKRSNSLSSEDNAFKHEKQRLEGKNIINVKPVVTTNMAKDTDLWKICHKDIYKDKKESRYYKQKRIVCNNCSEIGHISRNCKRLRKLPICYLCGKVGHHVGNCVKAACTRCLAIGHKVQQCQWSEIPTEKCPICDMMDHLREECPDQWRRYHITTKPGPIIYGNSSRNSRVYCYNCAKEGHFGHECNKERFDPDTYPTSPFISHYSKPTSLFIDNTYKNAKHRCFMKLAEKKEKCIRKSNALFRKKSILLQKKAERNILKYRSSPTSKPCKKPKKSKKKVICRNEIGNETNMSFASTSQETSKLLCIPQRRKRKAISNLQKTETQQKQRKKSKKKKKQLQNAVIKSEAICKDNNKTSIATASTTSNILKYLVPEISFSMACMRLFSSKSSGNC